MELTYFSRSGSLRLGRHYTSQQQGDATLLIEHSTNNLEQVGFDNTMSRYKIDGDETWLFYDQPNFEGLLFTATGPIGWTRVNHRYNDKVSSVRVVKEGEWGKITKIIRYQYRIIGCPYRLGNHVHMPCSFFRVNEKTRGLF